MILQGDCRKTLKTLHGCGVRAQCVVTSPPYFGQRSYDVGAENGELGLEQTPAEYVANMVEVFRLVRNVLADDGVLWLNLGDTYSSGGRKTRDIDKKLAARGMNCRPNDGAKPKDLLGIPWRVAFALQDDGWFLRQDIIWSKANPLPSGVADRCTTSHEYVFLLSKSQKYYFDNKSIREPVSKGSHGGLKPNPGKKAIATGGHGGALGVISASGLRNRRSVWTVPMKPYKGSHCAVMPPALVEPCVLAGSRPGDVVLDPFLGSGTVAQVAKSLGRKWVGCELNPDYIPLCEERIAIPYEPTINTKGEISDRSKN